MKEEWRICFGFEEEASKLIKPCDCKGSMEYVHEACINKWIVYSGIERCDLCSFKFHIKERFLNPFVVIKKLVKYMNKDKKRYVYWLLYLVYLYLYCKRIVRWGKTLWGIFKWMLRFKIKDKVQVFKILLSLVYNGLMSIQMTFLGAIEAKRIWSMLNVMISTHAKSIRILEKSEDTF